MELTIYKSTNQYPSQVLVVFEPTEEGVLVHEDVFTNFASQEVYDKLQEDGVVTLRCEVVT
jgi:hypothetical protein